MQEQSHNNSRARTFFKNFGIYTIGQLGQKIVNFLLLPLYTYFIVNPGDYGYWDLCLNFCMMFMPVATLQMRDSVFRFMYKQKDELESKRVFTFIASVIASNLALSAAIAIIIALTWNPDYMWHTFALLVLMSVMEVYIQTLRAIGKNKTFVKMNILLTLLSGVLNVLFVGVFKWGIEGIFLATISARASVLTITELKLGIARRYFSPKLWSLDLAKPIFSFCLPLLPYSICWWIIVAGGKFLLAHFNGLDAQGIYASASKFSAIIVTISGIFYQTWQESALSEYNSPDRDKFFSNVFNSYTCALCLILIGYTITIKMCYPWLVGPNYQSSLIYVWPLGVSSIMFALTSFFDMGYQGSKQTFRSIPSVVLAVCVNLTLNLLLIKPYGIWGCVIAQIASYTVLIAYRWRDTNKYFYHLSFYPRTLVPVAVSLLSAIPFYFASSVWLLSVIMVALISVGILFCPPLISDKVKHLLHIK